MLPLLETDLTRPSAGAAPAAAVGDEGSVDAGSTAPPDVFSGGDSDDANDRTVSVPPKKNRRAASAAPEGPGDTGASSASSGPAGGFVPAHAPTSGRRGESAASVPPPSLPRDSDRPCPPTPPTPKREPGAHVFDGMGTSPPAALLPPPDSAATAGPDPGDCVRERRVFGGDREEGVVLPLPPPRPMMPPPPLDGL